MSYPSSANFDGFPSRFFTTLLPSNPPSLVVVAAVERRRFIMGEKEPIGPRFEYVSGEEDEELVTDGAQPMLVFKYLLVFKRKY